jgi:hypothetical protein
VNTPTEPTAEAVLKMPLAKQRELLDAVLTGLGGHGIVQLELPDGPLHLYRPVPNARALAEESFRDETPEERAESERRAATPEDSMDFDEMMRIIDAVEDPDE